MRFEILSGRVTGFGARVARVGTRGVLRALISGASEEQIERRFGSATVQGLLSSGMARAFRPDAAGGFEGALVYELSRPASRAAPIRWTIEVSGARATAHRGSTVGAALAIRLTLADFVRIAAGTIDPAEPLLADRASFDGDFGLAARLPEMFGAPMR
jgi:hypothetical protein